MIDLAIDVEDLRVLVPFTAIVLIAAVGAIALVVTPWRRLERPAGLEDWQP